jgi:hypothetical protein
MADIEARMLELAKEALAEQERHVADMRTRGAAIMASADRLTQTREQNEDAVGDLRAWLHRAIASLVVLATALATGAALAS